MAVAARTWRSFFVIQYPLFLLGTAYATYAVMFGFVPGRTLPMVLLGSSPEELEGFFLIGPGKWLVFFLVGVSVAYLAAALRITPAPIHAARSRRFTRALVVMLVPTTVYAAWNPIQMIDGFALNPTVGSALFFGGEMVTARGALHGSRVHKIPYSARRTGGEEVHVLVVGESVRRDSWSAYGYPRPTTPYLSQLRGEAIFLSNATADANLTSWAVPIILTGMTPAAFEIGNIRGNLLDLAREAGYSTAWLVNQDLSISTVVGVDPDRLVNPPDFRPGWFGRHDWDEVLLPAFRREIERRGRSRFIGIHMMGSHWEYYLRYPPAFDRFGTGRDLKALSIREGFQIDAGQGQSALVDAYDNSTLYTDWFLHQLIEQARTLEVPASVTFFPDHGEDLYQLDGARAHGMPVYTRHAFEIPAFVWVNAAYRKQHPEIVAALEANAGKAVRSHDVFNTVGQLMGISWPEASPERSFASERFKPDTDMPRIAGGKLVPAQ